jgi:hypothetical protein
MGGSGLIGIVQFDSAGRRDGRRGDTGAPVPSDRWLGSGHAIVESSSDPTPKWRLAAFRLCASTYAQDAATPERFADVLGDRRRPGLGSAPLQQVNAVLTRAQERVELKVRFIVKPRGMVVDELRGGEQPELPQVPSDPGILKLACPLRASRHGRSGAGAPRRQVKDRVVETDGWERIGSMSRRCSSR